MFAMEGLDSLLISPFQRREEYIHYSAVTFRCLLDSLARPGKLNLLAYPTSVEIPPDLYLSLTAESVALNFHALAALATLLDSETSFVLAARGHWLDQDAAVVRWLALRTGSTMGSANTADFACFCDGRSGGLLRELHPGSLLEPESGATAFYCVQSLEEMENERNSRSWQQRGVFQQNAESELDHSSDDTIMLELRGPGIQECRCINVVGLDREEIRLIKATRRKFPLGVDIYLVDSAGRCVGLPRTTRLQVREQLFEPGRRGS
jgi:alpha-D-ribose 1-methylphosphonate 5-triphosphate synthase subunit PhnH